MPRRRRKKGQRRTKAVFVLACEDSKSSPSYFKALFRLYSAHVTPVFAKRNANKTSPKQVVERAVDRRSELERYEPQDQTWAIFDAEPQAGNAHKEQIRCARDLANREKISIAVSNPCIEHWLRLHFEDADGGYESAKKAVEALSTTWKMHCGYKYTKRGVNFERVISVDLVEKAARRAEAQHKQKNGALPECCPSCVTNVYKLVGAIQELAT